MFSQTQIMEERERKKKKKGDECKAKNRRTSKEED